MQALRAVLIVAMIITSTFAGVVGIAGILATAAVGLRTFRLEMCVKCENGAQSWNRTSDTRIFSPLLYQLSYLGKALINRDMLAAPVRRAGL